MKRRGWTLLSIGRNWQKPSKKKTIQSGQTKSASTGPSPRSVVRRLQRYAGWLPAKMQTSKSGTISRLRCWRPSPAPVLSVGAGAGRLGDACGPVCKPGGFQCSVTASSRSTTQSWRSFGRAPKHGFLRPRSSGVPYWVAAWCTSSWSLCCENDAALKFTFVLFSRNGFDRRA